MSAYSADKRDQAWKHLDDVVQIFKSRLQEEAKAWIEIQDQIIVKDAEPHFDHFGKWTKDGMLVSPETALTMATSYNIPMYKGEEWASVQDLADLQPNISEIATFKASMRQMYNLQVTGEGSI